MLLLALGQRASRGRTKARRFRVSEEALRRVTSRKALPEAFLSRLGTELAGLGYGFVRLGDSFAVVSASLAESWPLIRGAGTVGAELKKARGGDRKGFEGMVAAIEADLRPAADA